MVSNRIKSYQMAGLPKTLHLVVLLLFWRPAAVSIRVEITGLQLFEVC